MARELIPSLPPFSSLEFPVSSCSSFVKSDVKPSCNPQVIDLTSENSSTRMSQQPLRHMPPYPPHPPSAFHRVNHPPGHLPDGHGNAPSHGCPFLHHSQARQQQHHRSHNRLYHPPTNNAFCPLSMGSTVPLQHHPPHLGPPVLIDVDQVPDHIRAVPVTSLPNSLLVAAPTYVQPHQPPVDIDPRGNDPSTHHHHHYHHHHHHHHHFVQPPYQVPQPQAYQPYPSPGAMHYRHYRRWHQNSPSIPGWPSRRTHGPTPPPHPPLHTGVHPYPDLLYHLISAMSMQPIATQPPPPTWEEETYPQENYETLLNLAEQMGEVKPKGLSRVEIDQLPTYRVTAGSKTDDDKRCVVCLVDFEEKQLVRILPCLHEYHTRCIDKWLKSNRTCPICRAEVNVNSE